MIPRGSDVVNAEMTLVGAKNACMAAKYEFSSALGCRPRF